MVGRKRKVNPNYVPAKWFSYTSDSDSASEIDLPIAVKRRCSGLSRRKAPDPEKVSMINTLVIIICMYI